MLPWKEKLRSLRTGIGIKNLWLLLLAAGLFLLSIAAGGRKEKNEDTAILPQEVQKEMAVRGVEHLEDRLTELLTHIRGVGEAEVMITLADQGEKIVLKDQKSSVQSLNEADGAGGSRVSTTSEKEEETIYESSETPFVTKEYAAQVAGILIVCEGGADKNIVMDIVSAAEALFNVPAHRIVVLEMK